MVMIMISKLLSLETVLYQVKEMEQFYISYDRIASEKKASSEVLLIRLCNESLSQDMNAVLSRLSKLEAGVITAPASIPAGTPKSIGEISVKNEEPMQAVAQSEQKPMEKRNTGEFEGSVKLKNQLQNVAYIKPWIPQIRFALDSDRLQLIASPFVNSLLQSSDAKETILQAAQKIDPSIQDLIFVQSATMNTTENKNEFEGL